MFNKTTFRLSKRFKILLVIHLLVVFYMAISLLNYNVELHKYVIAKAAEWLGSVILLEMGLTLSMNYPGNPTPSSTGAGNPVPSSTGAGNSVVTPTVPAGIQRLQGFQFGDGSFIGHYTNSPTLKVFLPLDSTRLHGSDGNIYLANWVTDFRTRFYDAKALGCNFTKNSRNMRHVGVIGHTDINRINQLLSAARPEISLVTSLAVNEELIDSLYKL